MEGIIIFFLVEGKIERKIPKGVFLNFANSERKKKKKNFYISN